MLEFLERSWGLEIKGFGRPFHITKINQTSILVCDMDYHSIIELDLNKLSWRLNNGNGSLAVAGSINRYTSKS